MKKILKFSLVIIVIGVCIFTFTFFWNFFRDIGPGSYPNVETWCFKATERQMVDIIKEIKKEHPELVPPNEIDTIEKSRYWTFATFYYKETNENVYTWVRENDDNLSSTFALISIASHVDILNNVKNIKMYNKKINQDFGFFENRKEIKKFETKIISLFEKKANRCN